MPKHLFKPGQSGNPSGRPKLDPDVRDVIKSNGVKAAERMQDLLQMDELFHHKNAEGEFVAGKLSGKEQIAILALAQDRAFGRANDAVVSVTHTHSGSVGVRTNAQRMREISEKLPERIMQQRVIDERIEEAKLLDDID